MPIFAALMLGGMALGLTGQAVLDSTKNVTDTCNQISSAKELQSETEAQYNKLFKGASVITSEIKAYKTAVGNQKGVYETMTYASKEFAKIDRNSKIIGLCIFLFVLIIALLFKYFNVFGLIWGLFK